MDTNGLVTRRIEDGRKFIDQLAAYDFDVTVAFWVRTSEEDVWLFYIASTRADNRKLSDAYSELYGILRTMEGTTISASDVKLIGSTNPITTDVLQVRRVYPNTFVNSSILRQVGGVMVEEAYVYGPPETLRLSYTVRYVRKGQTNEWEATAERGKMMKNVRAKGAVAYTSAHWQGQSPSDENFAVVSVLLELDPRCDDRDLIVSPGVWEMFDHQAGLAADEMFKQHHPEAVVKHLVGSETVTRSELLS
jgi:hypothetical protein